MAFSSAPGKIILFGEHAVVYGRPPLAGPVTQVHADVEVRGSDRAGIWIDAPNVNLHAELNTLPSDHPLASVIHNFLFLSRISPFPDLEIKITSTIPVASDLGSGAAVTESSTGQEKMGNITWYLTDTDGNLTDPVTSYDYGVRRRRPRSRERAGQDARTPVPGG